MSSAEGSPPFANPPCLETLISSHLHGYPDCYGSRLPLLVADSEGEGREMFVVSSKCTVTGLARTGEVGTRTSRIQCEQGGCRRVNAILALVTRRENLTAWMTIAAGFVQLPVGGCSYIRTAWEYGRSYEKPLARLFFLLESGWSYGKLVAPSKMTLSHAARRYPCLAICKSIYVKAKSAGCYFRRRMANIQ